MSRLSHQPPSPDGGMQDDDGIARLLLMGRVATILLVVVVGGWSATASVRGAVIATGNITVESNSKSVQHLDGGIVREILVKNGDVVEKGDTLLRLDTTDTAGELSGVERRLNASKSEYDLIERELAGLRELMEQGLVTNERLMALEREAARLEGESGQLMTERTRLAAKIERADVRSPIGGYVHSMAIHTVGGVIAPGQEILKIVPSGDQLIAEVHLDPQDIDQVREGQQADIQITSLNRRNAPRLGAVVTRVSADLVQDEARNVAYYTVRLAFEQGELDRLDGHGIVPGMPVEAFVKTDRRTVLSYLVRPLTDQVARSFREE